VDRDSLIGIDTPYRLDGFESQWGARFSAPIQNDPDAHPASYTMGNGSFPGVKLPGRGLDYPPTSSAEVKEKVEKYFYLPSESLWTLLG